MSTLKPTKKISRRHELREDTVVTGFARITEFFEANKTVVYGALGAVVILLAAIVGYNYLQDSKQERAIVDMASAVRAFENGDYQSALNGVDGNRGLIEVVDDYGSTDAGNLARFYAADAYYRLGQYDEALEYFRSYKLESDYIGASALAGEAAIHELRGDYGRAGELYERAADLFVSEVTSPGYLISAARAYVKAGDVDNAIEAYEEIKASFSETPESQQVDILIAQAKVSNS